MKTQIKLIAIALCLVTAISNAQYWTSSKKLNLADNTDPISGIACARDSVYLLMYPNTVAIFYANGNTLVQKRTMVIPNPNSSYPAIDIAASSTGDTVFVIADSNKVGSGREFRIYGINTKKGNWFPLKNVQNLNNIDGIISTSSIMNITVVSNLLYFTFYYNPGGYKVMDFNLTNGDTSSVTPFYAKSDPFEQLTTDNTNWYTVGANTYSEYNGSTNKGSTTAKDIRTITYGGVYIYWSAGDSIVESSSLDTLINVPSTIKSSGYLDTTIGFIAANQRGDTIYVCERSAVSGSECISYLVRPATNPTSINEMQNTSQLKVYPNPFVNNLYLDLSKEADVRVYDELGQIVFQSRMQQGHNQLNIQGVRGLYLLSVDNVFRKLVKE